MQPRWFLKRCVDAIPLDDEINHVLTLHCSKRVLIAIDGVNGFLEELTATHGFDQALLAPSQVSSYFVPHSDVISPTSFERYYVAVLGGPLPRLH